MTYDQYGQPTQHYEQNYDQNYSQGYDNTEQTYTEQNNSQYQPYGDEYAQQTNYQTTLPAPTNRAESFNETRSNYSQQPLYSDRSVKADFTGSSSRQVPAASIPLSYTPGPVFNQPPNMQDYNQSNSAVNIFGNHQDTNNNLLDSPLMAEHSDVVKRNFETLDMRNSQKNAATNTCNACKFTNQKDANFCSRCGTTLVQRQSFTPQIPYASTGNSRNFNSTTPNTGHSSNLSNEFNDPLGRRNGNAIGIFTLGGIITLFPKKQTRVDMNNISKITIISGPIKIIPVHELVYKHVNDEIRLHGGPLLGSKNKLKKKDVLALIDKRILKIIANRDLIVNDSLNANVILKSKDLELMYTVLRLLVDTDGNTL